MLKKQLYSPTQPMSAAWKPITYSGWLLEFAVLEPSVGVFDYGSSDHSGNWGHLYFKWNTWGVESIACAMCKMIILAGGIRRNDVRCVLVPVVGVYITCSEATLVFILI